MPGTQKERQLIERAVAGEQFALEQLLLDHYDRLLVHVAGRMPAKYRSILSTEDIIQETHIQAFHGVGKFRPRAEGSFFSWLVAIAENRIRHAIKTLNRKKRPPADKQVDGNVKSPEGSLLELFDVLSAGFPTGSEVLRRKEREQAVRLAIAALPEEYGHVVELRYLRGGSVAEVAEATDKTPDAILGICKRAKKKMRESMGRSSLYFSSR